MSNHIGLSLARQNVQLFLTPNAVDYVIRRIEGQLNFVKVGAMHTQSICFYA